MSLPESFNPRTNPELALQTYEYFGGDQDRATHRAAFARGESAHHIMQYPKLRHAIIDPIVGALEAKHVLVVEQYGEASATASSVEYRLEEARFLVDAVELNHAKSAHDQQVVASRFSVRNEQLYGRGDTHHVAELWHDVIAAYGDTTDSRVASLWHQLADGFEFVAGDGEVVQIPPLNMPASQAGAPKLAMDVSNALRKEWCLFAGPLTEAHALMSDVIAAESGMSLSYDQDTIVFSGQRLYTAFCLGAVGIAEICATEPYGVEADPSATAASWQTADHNIRVGLNRSHVAGRSGLIRGVLSHESTHGLKAAQGAMSDEPALATGVFTRNTQGNWVSYLDYEEGNNLLGEQLLGASASVEPVKQAVYQLMVYMAQQLGYNDRQIQETYARLMVIEILCRQPGRDIREATEQANTFAAEKLERILRGAPTSPFVSVDGSSLVYTKDLAYRRGYRTAVNFWNAVGQDARSSNNPQQHVHDIFVWQNRGKIDPSEPAQARLIANSV